MTVLTASELDGLFEVQLDAKVLVYHYKSVLRRALRYETMLRGDGLSAGWLLNASHAQLVGRMIYSSYRALQAPGFEREVRRLVEEHYARQDV
ncbi:MAG: hypothetical protein HY516_00850 [Candidatus Aenigmarchaeota archaeon]|nr:hypothetical protein [Candidatus Aenigmarchaeota archaeon]